MTTEEAYWNGPAGERWARYQQQIDESFVAITEAWLAAVAPRSTDRVLDVGCGCGTTTRLLRPRVASALGVDISAPMLAVARERGGDYLLADAGSHPFEPSFDLVTSRFGVMFFPDPAAAFANLRRAFAPGARMVFACWRGADVNPWATVPLEAAGDLVPPLEPADPTAPGPFAFAQAEHVRDVLQRAGYEGVTLDPAETTMRLGPTPDEAAAYTMKIGLLARSVADLDDGVRERIRVRVASALERRGTTLPAAIWFVAAR